MRKIISPENGARTERFTVFLGRRHPLAGCSLAARPRQSRRSLGACGAQGLAPSCRRLHFTQKEQGARDVRRGRGAPREPAGAPGFVPAPAAKGGPVRPTPRSDPASWNCCGRQSVSGIHVHRLSKQLIPTHLSPGILFLKQSPGPHGNLPGIDFSIFLTVLGVTSCLCAYKWLQLSLFTTVTDMCAN